MYPFVITLSLALLATSMGLINKSFSKAHCIDNKINTAVNKNINKAGKLKKRIGLPTSLCLARVKVQYRLKGNIDNE